MPEETTTGADSGAATGDSTVPADTGSEQSSGTSDQDTTSDDNANVETADDEVDDDAVADSQVTKPEGDKPEGEKETAKSDEAKDGADAEASTEPKSLKEARTHISSLENQIRPLRDLENKVLEIGGAPVLELAQPLIDAALNPDAKASDVLSALQQVAPHLNPEQLAWDIVEEHKATVVADFFGDDITPEILEQLVTGYKAGDYQLDDDVFGLGDKGKGKDAGERKAVEDARFAELNTQRTTASTNVAQTFEKAVNAVLAPFADADGDTDEIKGLKEFIRDGVNAQIAVAMSSHAGFNRVQKLLQKNAFRPAETMATGSVAIAIQRMAEGLVKKANPFVAGTIGQAQKQAKKIKEVREEPSGASTQADVVPQQEEIDFTKPDWRDQQDAKLKRDLAALAEKAKKTRARGHDGQFV